MTDILAEETAPVTRDGKTRRSIMLIAQPGLLMECLADILRRRFFENRITVYADLSHIPAQLDDEAPLILCYHQDTAKLDTLIRDFKRAESGISLGLIIDDQEESDQHVRLLAASQLIDGVIPLNLRLDVFLATVDLLAKGGEHFPSALLQHLSTSGAGYGSPAKLRMVPPAHPGHTGASAYMLTTREVEILDLICKGTLNKVIAGQLGLSENTVKVHVRNIYKKMNVRNRTEAASLYFDYGSGSETRLQAR